MLLNAPGHQDLSRFLVHMVCQDMEGGIGFLESILGSGVLEARRPAGAAANAPLPQKCVCLSEIPIGFLDRLAKRRGAWFGVGFHKDHIARKGGAPVWYLPKGSHPRAWFEWMVKAAGTDPNAPIWNLTPFVEFVEKDNQFEWEREWRVLGDLRFDPWDVAFLLGDLQQPEWVQSRTRQWLPYQRHPWVDPRWDFDEARARFPGLALT